MPTRFRRVAAIMALCLAAHGVGAASLTTQTTLSSPFLFAPGDRLLDCGRSCDFPAGKTRFVLDGFNPALGRLKEVQAAFAYPASWISAIG